MQRELSAKLTEGVFSVDYRFLQSLRHGKPCHLPLHKGGLGLVPLKRVYVIIAWLAGQYTAHLCAASIIRAMPENEIPPYAGGYLFDFVCEITKTKKHLLCRCKNVREFACGNILRLAAASQVGVALRRGCEPIRQALLGV